MKIDRFDLEQIPIGNLIRLCKWLGIHESSDFKKSSIINWLIYEGHCSDPKAGGWS